MRLEKAASVGTRMVALCKRTQATRNEEAQALRSAVDRLPGARCCGSRFPVHPGGAERSSAAAEARQRSCTGRDTLPFFYDSEPQHWPRWAQVQLYNWHGTPEGATGRLLLLQLLRAGLRAG